MSENFEEYQVNMPKRPRPGNDLPQLMDRSGIVRSSFIRLPNDRGQTPSELVGRVYRQNLSHLLQQTAKRGAVWKNCESKWPEVQLAEQLVANKEAIEYVVTPEELKNIEFYITQDIRVEDVEQLPPPLWERVMNKTKKKFTQDRRLRDLLLWLREQAERDWDRGSREALLGEALLDPRQQQRLGVRSLPPVFPRFVVTGPAPWAESFRAARAFCAFSLMCASMTVLTAHPIWQRQLGDEFEILPVKELTEFRPFYLDVLENKVNTLLTTARKMILYYQFSIAEHMWVRQREWSHLVLSNKEEDLVRLMNCLSSLTSRRLRDKTLEARAAWTSIVLSVLHSTATRPVKPLVKYRLDDSTQRIRDDLERTKEFVATTFLHIFEVTRQLPTVGTLMFNPNHKYQMPHLN